ncbi:MAG TPA: hypothetical protein VND91_06650 [Candidatus Saccharimonadia bacterium]|nr:hypothetical protein [Candidatus Saccharimonadia bacterium]
MLRLVHARAPNAKAPLRRVAISGLDDELAAYLERRLRARWPSLQVHRERDRAALEPSADLWICGTEPPEALQVPTLWLGELDRGAGVVRVGTRLWKCSTPITGRQLVRCVDEMWGETR